MSTMGVFEHKKKYHYFSINIKNFLTIRYGHGPPFDDHYWGPAGNGSFTYPDYQMRMWFYRKVVLSSSPARSGNYAVMLITDWKAGAPAFYTAEDPVWRLAPSHDGVEDAIYHDGQFYSVSYTGLVEAWERDAVSGAYTSTAVAPRLAVEEHKEEGSEPSCRKYLAAAPGGRLMVVIKYPEVVEERFSRTKWSCSFKVHALGDDGQWKETTDIGDLALFVGMNNSVCISTIGRPQIEAGCVYYTDDLPGAAEVRKMSSSHSYDDGSDLRVVGVYSLMDGKVKKMEALGKGANGQRIFDPPPVWIMPSFP